MEKYWIFNGNLMNNLRETLGQPWDNLGARKEENLKLFLDKIVLKNKLI